MSVFINAVCILVFFSMRTESTHKDEKSHSLCILSPLVVWFWGFCVCYHEESFTVQRAPWRNVQGISLKWRAWRRQWARGLTDRRYLPSSMMSWICFWPSPNKLAAGMLRWSVVTWSVHAGGHEMFPSIKSSNVTLTDVWPSNCFTWKQHRKLWWIIMCSEIVSKNVNLIKPGKNPHCKDAQRRNDLSARRLVWFTVNTYWWWILRCTEQTFSVNLLRV